MKLLYVLPALVAASQKPVYYARLGEFCGEADNGDYHACHGDLTCHQKQCVSGHATGHLRGYHSYHKYGYPKYDWPYKYQHPYYSGAESHPFYRGHMAYPHPYMGSQIGALASSSAWASVKLEDYTAEGQPCSGITGLGAGQKPCAPWLACYKHTFSGSLFGRAYGGYYGHSQSGHCKAKLVHLGQRCGRSESTHAEINMGRCPAWSHCQPDVGFVNQKGGELLGGGICIQTPIERVEDFLDPFHSALT